MRRSVLLLTALGAVLLGGCGAVLVRPPVTVTILGTVDDGDDCLASNDVTAWPAGSSRTLVVEARLVGASAWTEILRTAAVTGPISPTLSVSGYGRWEFRAMVADSTGAGCWTATVARTVLGRPSKATAS